MYIDTHTHLSKKDYDDIEKVIEDAKEQDVLYLIISGCDKEGIKESIEIANTHNNICLALGYHPSETSKTTDKDLEELEEIIKTNKKVVALGEIGLDYYWEKDNKEEQKELFKKQIEIAKKYDLPLVIHSRDAFQDTYDILKKANYKGVIHCFSGNVENAKMYLSLGFYLGIGGVITFKNTNLKETIKEIPIDKILLETDAPYLAPTPHRGEKNESKHIPIIAEEIGNLLNKTKEEIGEITTQNAIKMFNKDFNRDVDY